MEQRQTRPKSRKPVVFRDGLGRRCRTLDSAATELEVLCLRPELSTAAHEAALRERVGRLANVRSGSFARVRAVQRLNDSASTLALVSAATPGTRLSEILTTSERLGTALDGSAGWAIVLQLTSAVALMHEHAPDVANGSIAPERIVVTPDARVVVVEHVLGSLIEGSLVSQDQAWKDQRVASLAGEAFDLRTDVVQLGVVALSLVLGRALRDDEYPARLSQLVESAMVTSVTGGREPMAAGLRSWLDRALQLDERRSFASAIEASAELHRLLEETDSVVVPLALEAFLSRLQAAIERDRQTPAPAPAVTVAAEDAPTTMGETPVVADPVEPEPVPAPALAEMTTPAAVYTGAEVTLAPVAGPPVGSVANPALQSFASFTESPRETMSSEPFKSTQGGASGSFWKEHPWSRQAAAAAVLTVLVGLGWAASRGAQVRAEPSQPIAVTEPAKVPEPAPIAEPTPAPVPALPEVEIKKTAASVAPAPAAPAAMPAPAAAPVPVASGWVTVTAPHDLNVFENGALVGTSRGGRIKLPVGAHQLELVGESIGYRETRSVDVRNNANASVSVALPNGTLSLNATPWAEVLVDGKSVGETPIGNLSIGLGQHEVVFRHPELGEKRMTATVTLTGPTRLTADLRK